MHHPKYHPFPLLSRPFPPRSLLHCAMSSILSMKPNAWKRIVTKTESKQPTEAAITAAGGTRTERCSTTTTCFFCSSHSSSLKGQEREGERSRGRYTCSRCGAKLCSVQCFKSHNGGACNEEFSRDQVVKVNELAERRKKQEGADHAMRGVLQREMMEREREREREDEDGDGNGNVANYEKLVRVALTTTLRL